MAVSAPSDCMVLSLVFTVIFLVVLVSLFIAARFGYIGFHIK